MNLLLRAMSAVKSAQSTRVAVAGAKQTMAKLGTSLRDAREVLVEREYQKACQGDAAAQFAMGERCYEGLGVAKDYFQAAQWFIMAAGQNHPIAQRNLGMMYVLGRGVDKDLVEGFKWLKLAAARSDPAAGGTLRKVQPRLSPEELREAETRVQDFRPKQGR